MGIFGKTDPTGIVGGAMSLISQNMANRQETANLHRQNEWNKQAAKQQFKYDTEAWNRQNLYNSPAQVMARYKAAGLNPNLIYGGGMGNTAGSAPAQQVPKQDKRQISALHLGEMLGKYQDTQLQKVQIDNARLQGDLLEKEKLIKTAEANNAAGYYFGRKQEMRGKGLLKNQEWHWSTEFDPEYKEKTGLDRIKGFTLRDTDLDYKKTQINKAIQSILLMDTDMQVKQKLLDYYDFNQIFKFAQPLVGVTNKLIGKLGAGSKGISGKFKGNDFKPHTPLHERLKNYKVLQKYSPGARLNP